jgi:peptide/nickel transport system ATP-binding protein
MAEHLMEARGLTMHFPVQSGALLKRQVGVVQAVDGIDLDLHAGESFGLVGESGCGKSTTGRLLTRLLEPTAGTITYAGRDITHANRKQLAPIRSEIQMIFQDPYSSLNPRMTLQEVIGEPLFVNGLARGEELRDRVARMLRRVGLRPEYVTRYPHGFSGGQRQRIGIARALISHPQLVVCDEPVSALDVSIQAQILNLLKDLQRDFALTYLFIAHDLAVVRSMSDRIAVMNKGQLVEIGPAEEVYTNPQDDYTKALLSAVPIPDPRAMKERKAARRKLRHALAEG